MITKEEITPILIATIAITVALSLFRDMHKIPLILASVFIVIAINTLAKKIAGFYLNTEVETRLWHLEGRFRGLNDKQKPYKKFKKPFAAGIIFPLISRILFYPFGNAAWTASLIFDVKPKASRSAKKHQLYSYSEMTEHHIGLIAAAGVLANLVFAVIGYLIDMPEFSRINIYMAFFNMIPISDLDGNKILFGNKALWSLLASLVVIAVGYNLLLV